MRLSKIMLGTLIVFSVNAYAQANYKDYKDAPTVAPCLYLKDGFYLGVQAGYDSYHVKQTDSLGAATASTSMSPTGWVGGLFAGFGKDLNAFYLGGEVFINDSSAEATNSFSNTALGVSGTQKFSANTSYGVAILPGIKFTPATLSYIRLGWNWARLKVQQSLTGAIDNYSASNTDTYNGFAYGLGFETLLPQIDNQVSLRGEYTYTNYNSKTPAGGQLKFSPSDNQFMLSLIYHI